MAICVAIVGKDNSPKFFYCTNPDEDFNLQYKVLSAQDVIEEKLNTATKATESKEPYLGILYSFETYKMYYGYVTNTKIKFIIVVDSTNTVLRDNEIRSMFRKLHSAYTDNVCNPFHIPGEEITSNVNEDTLYSILSYEHQKLVKKNYFKYCKNMEKYYDLYMESVRINQPAGIIVKLAQDAKIAPCLMAKFILTRYHEEQETLRGGQQIEDVSTLEGTINLSIRSDSINKQTINKYLRDTTKIQNPTLAYEVFLCTIYDDIYGPSSDIIRNSIGQQFEILLYKQVTELGLAFRDENDMRRYGFDKTPDIKLEIPIAIDGFIIHWIESKALFGHEEVHDDYIKNQYSCYWNRFGPGLVIYWLGYLQTILTESEKRFIIRDHMPTKIFKIN